MSRNNSRRDQSRSRNSNSNSRGPKSSNGNSRPSGRKPFKRKEQDNDSKYVTKTKANVAGGDNNVRLNRFLANAGICSRREADDLIAAGLVEVNGKVIQEMGYKVAPRDKVRFNGSEIRREAKVYYVLNKPKGFITTTNDPKARKTVMDLMAQTGPERIYPVGRLDRQTTGVLLFTNDGDFAKRLTHPSHGARKVYDVTLDKNLDLKDFHAIAEGLELNDGPIKVDDIAFVEGKDRNHVGVVLHSGRNRIVRRIFEHLGYTVTKLDRTVFAGITKKNLRRGQWRKLNPKEVNTLMMH
ncbi:pseudouridine synthase [Croceimicrobium sp.]|uniref:pseudouridine synthase n=1 Tax=Croceimicrobium sp. TaxID=2828340 RepID=UPI003BA98A18